MSDFDRLSLLLTVLGFGMVVGFVFGWGDATQPVHEAVLVVQVDPRRGGFLQVGDLVERAGTERRSISGELIKLFV